MSKAIAIVTAKRNKPTTTSLIVAESCGVQHKNTLALIRKYQADFETFGLVAFETQARLKGQHGGGDSEFVNLNESQATYLITLFKNTEIVRAFKLRLVQEFAIMRESLSNPTRNKIIQDKRDSHSFMTDSLMLHNDLLGVETKSYQYANENLICNLALCGESRPIAESELDNYDALLLRKIRERNALLIQRDIDYNARKELLIEFANQYRTKKPRLQLVA
jgi:phage regulator Rha-like protein